MTLRAVVFLGVVLAGCAHSPRPGIVSHSALPANLARGRSIYSTQCAACHGRDGIGGPVGPALHNERARRSYAAVRAIVVDPEPPMPKLYPARLTLNDVRDVAAYVEAL